MDMPVEEPGTFESVVSLNQQMKSETGTSACRSENGSTIARNDEAQEETCEKVSSTLPTTSIESTHGAVGGELLSPSQEDVQEFKEAENDSNRCESCANIKRAEADAACEASDPGDSVHFMDTLTAVTLRGNTAGSVGENHELHLGSAEAPNRLELEYQLPVLSEGNFDPIQKMVPRDLNKPPDASLIASNEYSLASSEIVVSPKANEALLRESVFNQASEALICHTSIGTTDALSFVDFSKQQLPNQETSTAVVVSTDLDGWQRFDAEESEVNGVLGFKQTDDGASQKRLELWEQLLEDGLEGSAQCIPTPSAPVEPEVGIESSLHDGNQFWLASPGNPFIEGLERSSNFSEADGFITNADIIRSHSLRDYPVEDCPSSHKGLIQSDDIRNEKSPGFINNKGALAEEDLGSQWNDMRSDGTKRIAQQRFPSFSDIRRSSSRPRDTSFLSFKEQEPAHQPSNGHEENWEANFDLMAPEIHKGPRSLSLPREASDLEREASFSLYSSEAPVTSQSKLSGFLSPKLSPIVKKVVSKVRTAPDQVLNVARQKKVSKAMDKKESTRKWTWRYCMCCSHGS